MPESAPDGGLGGHPKGLSNLFYAEMWERFSYYGMRALLLLFMMETAENGGMGWDQAHATLVYGNYTMLTYMVCILGGFVADNFLGARRAVLIGGCVITVGHFTLAVPGVTTFYAGLALVAAGTGLLKPSISTLVGGLYAPGDHRRDAGFSIFYMGINLGAFAAPLATGWLAQGETFKSWLKAAGLDPSSSWHWGFGAAGIGMAFGMWIYVRRLSWLGRTGAEPAHAHGRRPWGRLAAVACGTAALGLALALAGSEPWVMPALCDEPTAHEEINGRHRLVGKCDGLGLAQDRRSAFDVRLARPLGELGIEDGVAISGGIHTHRRACREQSFEVRVRVARGGHPDETRGIEIADTDFGDEGLRFFLLQLDLHARLPPHRTDRDRHFAVEIGVRKTETHSQRIAGSVTRLGEQTLRFGDPLR